MAGYKPSYFKFIKTQMFFKKKDRYYISENNKKYIESKKTLNISLLSNLIILLILVIPSKDGYFAKLNVFFQVLLVLFLILLLLFILATIHWFYAKFDLAEESNKVNIEE